MADRIRHKIKNLLMKLNDFWRRMRMLRNIARKPIPKMKTYLKYGFVITEHEQHLCPRCKGVLNAGPNYQPKYCSQCGQKLNFLGIKWKEDKKLGFAKVGEDYEQIKDRMV